MGQANREIEACMLEEAREAVAKLKEREKRVVTTSWPSLESSPSSSCPSRHTSKCKVAWYDQLLNA